MRDYTLLLIRLMLMISPRSPEGRAPACLKAVMIPAKGNIIKHETNREEVYNNIILGLELSSLMIFVNSVSARTRQMSLTKLSVMIASWVVSWPLTGRYNFHDTALGRYLFHDTAQYIWREI